MTLHFTLEAWEEYQYWQSTDRKRLNRLNRLIRETLRTPYAGIGKPGIGSGFRCAPIR